MFIAVVNGLWCWGFHKLDTYETEWAKECKCRNRNKQGKQKLYIYATSDNILLYRFHMYDNVRSSYGRKVFHVLLCVYL